MSDTESINPVAPIKDEPKAKPRAKQKLTATVRRSRWVGGDARHSYDPDEKKGHGPFNLVGE